MRLLKLMEQLSSHPRILQNSYMTKVVAMVKRNMGIKHIKARVMVMDENQRCLRNRVKV